MQRDIATIDDHDTVGRLTDAIDGKGAFRRFYIQLERYPDLLTRWHRFTTTPDSAKPANGSPMRNTNPAAPPEARRARSPEASQSGHYALSGEDGTSRALGCSCRHSKDLGSMLRADEHGLRPGVGTWVGFQ